MKKTSYNTNYYNNNPNYIQHNIDYKFRKEEKYYYQKRTTKIKSYSILYPNKNNNINNYYLRSPNNDKITIKQINNNSPKLKLSRISSKEKLLLSNNKNNICIINNKNSLNKKLSNNNIDLIKKKKELENQREKERKIMEWFYINDIDLSKKDLYETMAMIIQSVFRGWQFRRKIENFCDQAYNIYEINNNIKNGCIHLNKIYLQKINKNLKFFLSQLNNHSKIILLKKNNDEDEEKEKLYEDIKELIKQNNKLQKELNIIITENK